MGLNIIFEDEQILVVKKDAGIPVQAGRMRMMDLQGLIKNELYKRNRSGGEPYLGLIHRSAGGRCHGVCQNTSCSGGA